MLQRTASFREAVQLPTGQAPPLALAGVRASRAQTVQAIVKNPTQYEHTLLERKLKKLTDLKQPNKCTQMKRMNIYKG